MKSNTPSLTKAEISEARSWVMDCVPNSKVMNDVLAWPDQLIINFVARNYEGGLEWFRKACSCNTPMSASLIG